MDELTTYQYYIDLVILGVGVAFSGFLAVGSVVQLALVNFRTPKLLGSNLYFFTQFLQAAVELGAYGFLITWLRAGIASPWIIFVVTLLVVLLGFFMSRYRNRVLRPKRA
jgi:hypothetical protein